MEKSFGVNIQQMVLPLIVIYTFSSFGGIFGGYLSACVLLPLNEGRYFSGIESSVTMSDIQGCFLKAAVFAIIVITVCCYQGYNAHRRNDGKGAEAVGNATTSAVVMSCVLILVADYVLTSFLL